MNERTRRASTSALGILLLSAALFSACEKAQPPPPVEPPARPAAPEPAPDDAPEALDPAEEAPPRPVEELSEEELEAECYRGRREACDLLGH